MIKKIIIIILILLTFINISFSQENPFFGGSTPDKNKQVKPPAYPGYVRQILNNINTLQQELNSYLSTLSRKINNDADLSIFMLLLGITVFYGFIHALGPGHGKIIMISYALSNPLKVKQGILLGIFIAVIHTFSAILLVSILYFILKSTYSGYSQEPKQIISLVSYGLIAGMGFFLIVKTIILDILKLNKKSKDSEIKIEEKQNRIQNLIIPAFIIGLIPCEGAILILIFSITINAYYLGIILTLAMSCGIAITISIMGIIMIYSKKGALKLIQAKTGIIKIVSTIIQLLGSTVIFIFGSLLFLSNLV